MALYRIITPTVIERFPDYIEVDGKIHTNADAEALALESGEWHELIVSFPPVLTNANQYLLKEYVLEDDGIHCNWTVNTMIPNTEDA